jgi:hypothetical protein
MLSQINTLMKNILLAINPEKTSIAAMQLGATWRN